MSHVNRFPFACMYANPLYSATIFETNPLVFPAQSSNISHTITSVASRAIVGQEKDHKSAQLIPAILLNASVVKINFAKDREDIFQKIIVKQPHLNSPYAKKALNNLLFVITQEANFQSLKEYYRDPNYFRAFGRTSSGEWLIFFNKKIDECLNKSTKKVKLAFNLNRKEWVVSASIASEEFGFLEFDGHQLVKNIPGMLQYEHVFIYQSKAKPNRASVKKYRFISKLFDCLDDLIANKLLTTYEKIDIFFKVCGIVCLGHDKGILFRDIKQRNILLKTDKTPIICDFGSVCRDKERDDLAKEVSAEDTTSFYLRKRITAKASTPYYVSPEYAQAYLNIGAQGDFSEVNNMALESWQLGCLGYELLYDIFLPWVEAADESLMDIPGAYSPHVMDLILKYTDTGRIVYDKDPRQDRPIDHLISDLLEVDPSRRLTDYQLRERISLYSVEQAITVPKPVIYIPPKPLSKYETALVDVFLQTQKSLNRDKLTKLFADIKAICAKNPQIEYVRSGNLSISDLYRTIGRTPSGDILIFFNKSLDICLGNNIKKVKLVFNLTKNEWWVSASTKNKTVFDLEFAGANLVKDIPGMLKYEHVFQYYSKQKFGRAITPKYRLISKFYPPLLSKMLSLTLDEKISIAYKLCRTVIVVHKAGIIFRDLKTPNILLSKAKDPLICDFGSLYRVQDQYDSKVETSKVHLRDRIKRMDSTNWYVSPEFANEYLRQHEQDVKSKDSDKFDLSSVNNYALDMWGLGCVITELLFYQKDKPLNKIFPWWIMSSSRVEIFKLFQKHTSTGSIVYLNPADKPKETRRIDELIDRLMAVDPSKRLTAEQLEKILDGIKDPKDLLKPCDAPQQK